MAELELTAALLRGGASALVVTALLWAAQRWGRNLAGLLAGLPTVTGPAMVWLALDRGSDFATQAAHGAVLAAVPCALFALAYAWLAAGCGRVLALAVAVAVSVLALPLALMSWPMLFCVVLGGAASLACLRLMPQVLQRMPASASATRGAAARAACMTVLVAAVVSSAASLWAPALGLLAAGALTSPPLLAAAIAWELHRQRCPARVLDFLRGYTAGLISRTLFVAVFGVLLAPHGLQVAVAAALGLAVGLGWATRAWMQRRLRLAMMRP